jgi:hypothetical protein
MRKQQSAVTGTRAFRSGYRGATMFSIPFSLQSGSNLEITLSKTFFFSFEGEVTLAGACT